MSERLEQILELPMQYRLLILGLTVGLIGGAFYFLSYSVEAQELEKESKAVEALQLEIREKTGIAANLAKFEGEVSRLDVELNKALKELPDNKEIANLLQQISDKARDSGLDIRLFQPQPNNMKDFYAEIPVQIEIRGTYHQVGTFFDELAHLERIVNVDQFNVLNPEIAEDKVLTTTTALATSFRFLEESERPKQEEQTDKKRRRKAKKSDDE